MTSKRFPVLSEDRRLLRSIPWKVIEPHEPQALRNHDQTLAELAHRGGLALCEMAAILEDRPWRAMAVEDALAVVLARLSPA